jgi:3-dehydroquinate dehydratase-2
MDSTTDRTIYVLNGPNLNLLGTREPQTYRYGEPIEFIHQAHAKAVSVEAHVSNIHARENFRHQSSTAGASFAGVCGFATDGYRLAIDGLPTRIEAKA